MRYFFLPKALTNILVSISTPKPSRAMSQLPKVFVKHVDAEEKVKIYFLFSTPDLPERSFTFLRSKEERLELTLSRMKLKILEAINNKLTNRKKKKKVLDDDIAKSDVSVSLSLLKGNEPVSLEIKNVEAWVEDVTLKINDIVYEISQNPPAVLHLSLPKSIMAGFPVYPKIDLEYCCKDECDFSWYRTLTKSVKSSLSEDDPRILRLKNENWLYLSSGFFYVSSEADVGCKLRVSCIPKCGEKRGLEEIAVSTNGVEMGPVNCPFEERHQYTKELTGPDKIRCVSYNILADLYADSDTARNELFPYCPPEALMFDYRKQLYMKEIIGYHADLICLQEVDRKVFFNDLVPVLSSTGLEGIYSEKGGQVVEGLSCFYRGSKFKLVESHAIILSEAVSTEPVLQPILDKLSENENLKERFMNRTTALQVVLLESIDASKRRLLVGNTHLYFRPISDNIRLLQATSCLLYLENLLKKYKDQDPTSTTALVLCGDFNSTPECAVYNFITNGTLDKDVIDWQSNPEEIVPGIKLSHSLTLDSACGTPEYTNFTEGFVGCLDYIYFDTSCFEVKDVVPFPKHEQVIKNKAIPSVEFPSDHIALVSTLEWKS